MRIRMVKTSAGPGGSYSAGWEGDVPASIGQDLLDSKAAVLVRGVTVEKKIVEPEEKAVAVWEEKISPEIYLKRWPNGPKAELAKRVLG